ncbi:MAG: PHP domain-containing protein [Endomicrobium sp.]|jgi:histidinol-phosphatase (PHP family)|nr:PHP domain-containing protein [Endomicrobium sp.]
MIKADVHVHSKFSPDSKTEVIFHIEKAIEQRAHSICITDHYDIIYLYKKNDAKEKYKREIDILIGVEVGLLSQFKKQINEFLNRYEFDFIIGSSHFVGNIEPYQSIFWENRSEKEALRNYFESILENVKIFKNYDVYGHLDYYVPF